MSDDTDLQWAAWMDEEQDRVEELSEWRTRSVARCVVWETDLFEDQDAAKTIEGQG